MNNTVVRGQVRLGAITHQSLGREHLKDTSCLNGKEKVGAMAVESLGNWGVGGGEGFFATGT